MANTNNQRGDKGFNIIYRSVVVLAAAATFPVMFFTSLFYFAYTIPIIGMFGSDSSDTGASYFSASIYQLLTEYKSYADLFSGKTENVDVNEVFQLIKGPLITIGCLYVALCVLALVIIVFAAFTRKKIPIIVSSAAGAGVLIAIPFAFRALQAPFLDGTINLDSFLHTGLESIMSLLVTVDFIRAGDAYTYLWVIFGGILAWMGAIMLVSMGDEKKVKEPKEKKPKKVKEPKEETVEEQ